MGWIRKMLVRWLVGSADSVELSRIVLAVLRRYGQLFAEEEVVFSLSQSTTFRSDEGLSRES